MNVKVYVPLHDGLPYVARGSGIVGDLATYDPGRLLVYYEGNIYGMSNIKTFADRVYHAAGRLLQHYPTIAVASVLRSRMEEVGVFDGNAVKLHSGKESVLETWLSPIKLTEAELVRSDPVFVA